MTNNRPVASSASEATPLYRKRLYRAAAILFLFVAMLLLVPVGIKLFAESFLKDMGAENASIENVDFNPFIGVLTVSGVQAGAAGTERLYIGSLEVDIRWWPLLSQRVHVEAIKISDAQIDIALEETGTVQVGKLRFEPSAEDAPEEQQDKAASSWGFGSDIVQLTNVTLGYHDTSINKEVVINEIMLGTHANWDEERNTPLIIDLNIDGAPILLRGDVVPWADQQAISAKVSIAELELNDHLLLLQQFMAIDELSGSLSLELELSASISPDGALELLVKGPLELANAIIRMPAISVSNQLLRWEAQTRLRFPVPVGTPLLDSDGSLAFSGMQAGLADPVLNLELSNVDWAGQLNVSLDENGDPALLLEGALAILDTQVQLKAQALDVALAEMKWSGTAGSSGAGPELNGTFTAGKLNIEHAGLPFRLVMLETLSAGDIVVTPTSSVSIPLLSLKNLRLLAEPQGETPDVFSLAQLDLTTLSISELQHISAQTLTFTNPSIVLARNEDGSFARIDSLLEKFAPEATESADTASASTGNSAEAAPDAAMNFALGSLQINAEHFLTFEDRSLAVPASFKLDSLQMQLEGLSSAEDSPAKLTVSTGFGNMILGVQGTLTPFNPAVDTDLALTLSGLDLPPLSPYLSGLNIERGRFSSTSAVVIKQDVLRVNNDVVVDRLQLSGKETDKDSVMGRGLGMPLDVALDLLRDGDDRIALNLPVSGSLSDPQFDISDILQTATQKALQKAALSYVKNALQPLGTLMLIGNLAAEASRPRFEPVAMAPGLSMLTVETRQYLFKLSELLNERPSLQLSICSVATNADRAVMLNAAKAALVKLEQEAVAESGTDTSVATEAEAAEPEIEITDAQLLQLAAMRTAEVIGFLVDEAGLSHERLFNCRDTLEMDAQQAPRTEITL